MSFYALYNTNYCNKYKISTETNYCGENKIITVQKTASSKGHKGTNMYVHAAT